MGQYALLFISGKYKTAEFPLPESGELLVGRSADLDLVLSEEMVSRKHAKMKIQGDSMVLTDLGSTNGTYVNGEKIRRHDVTLGDRLLLGTSIIRVIEASDMTIDEAIRDDADAVRQMMSEISEKNVESITMTGSLAEVPLPDLLQLFASNRRSGVLGISGDHNGKLYLNEGQVEFALIEGQDLAPYKAFCRMIGWGVGDFSLEDRDEDQTFSELLTEPTENLLMEATRQSDELQSLYDGLPATDTGLTWAVPMMPKLSSLSKEQLDTIQLVLNCDNIGEVVEESPRTDHGVLSDLQYLLRQGYLEEE
ncbi:MAG: DUF4388 domain-containing protein [Deltaproteobacteria bacterium]|jgi:pSer/pThr/pTyr-binding forkhead associated (FHA) protein|nr:DUF4388 domain-containing protein [Deltaproteobacteria bacterium]MBT6431471.1 DUF4388 domain-containing protein [Deltaproteobacteria bacterium]MBT6489659.1 DUF4388 domain-containing protein [Deltaproteobacteria bacterium]